MEGLLDVLSMFFAGLDEGLEQDQEAGVKVGEFVDSLADADDGGMNVREEFGEWMVEYITWVF